MRLKNFLIFSKKFDFFKFLSGYYMRGKFAGTFENRIRNLQATLKETSVQPQSERDNNRRRPWVRPNEVEVKFLRSRPATCGLMITQVPGVSWTSKG